jgi:hypothetical protein
MTAGHSVTHTERTPGHLRDGKEYPLHGYQIWVALPRDLEDTKPDFQHLAQKELPIWQDHHATFTLVAGEAFGRQSPLKVHSPLFFVDMRVNGPYDLNMNDPLLGEMGVIVVEGEVTACGQTIQKGQMLVSKALGSCSLQVNKGSRLLLLGGQPFPEERHIFWNFVSSDPTKIEHAIQKWKDGAFPKVPNDDTYVKIPEIKGRLKGKSGIHG